MKYMALKEEAYTWRGNAGTSESRGRHGDLLESVLVWNILTSRVNTEDGLMRFYMSLRCELRKTRPESNVCCQRDGSSSDDRRHWIIAEDG
jgi:hypothetical protein